MLSSVFTLSLISRRFWTNSSILIIRFGVVGSNSGADFDELARFLASRTLVGIDLENLFAKGNSIQTGVSLTSCFDFNGGSKILRFKLVPLLIGVDELDFCSMM